MERIIRFETTKTQTLLSMLNRIIADREFSKLFSFVRLGEEINLTDVSGPDLVKSVKIALANTRPHIGIFLDLKFLGTSGEIKNILNNYYFSPNMLSLSSDCSVQTVIDLRRSLPKLKLVMASLAYDIDRLECCERFELTPEEKILSDYQSFQNYYRQKISSKDNPEPFDGIICSASQEKYLRGRLDNRFFVVEDSLAQTTPGIYQIVKLDKNFKVSLFKSKLFV